MNRSVMPILSFLLLALLLAACAGAAPAQQAPVQQTVGSVKEVNITNFSFDPSSLTITVGTIVK